MSQSTLSSTIDHTPAVRMTYVVQMGDSVGLQFLLAPEPLETDGEQSELFPPISEVVYPGDLPSVSFVQVGQEGTDDRRSEVTGVEGFGDVGRGEFDCVVQIEVKERERKNKIERSDDRPSPLVG